MSSACSEDTKVKAFILCVSLAIFGSGFALGQYAYACTDLQAVQQSKVKLEATLYECQEDLGSVRDQLVTYERMENQCQDELARCQSALQEKKDVHGTCQSELVTVTSEKKYATELKGKLETEKKDFKEELKKQRAQCEADRKEKEEKFKEKEEKFEAKLQEYVDVSTKCQMDHVNLTRSLEFCEQSKGAEISKSGVCAVDLSECKAAKAEVAESIQNLTSTIKVLDYDKVKTKEHQEKQSYLINWIAIGSSVLTFFITCILWISYLLCVGKLSWHSIDPSEKFLSPPPVLESEQAREEADRLKREAEERLAREEADRLKREAEERLAREEAERLKREAEVRLAREEAERIKREEEERLKREEEADRLNRLSISNQRNTDIRTEPERIISFQQQMFSSSGKQIKVNITHDDKPELNLNADTSIISDGRAPNVDEILQQQRLQTLEKSRSSSFKSDIPPVYITQPRENDETINLFTPEKKVDIVPKKRKVSSEEKQVTMENNKVKEPKRVKHQHDDSDSGGSEETSINSELEVQESDPMNQENDVDEVPNEDADLQQRGSTSKLVYGPQGEKYDTKL